MTSSYALGSDAALSLSFELSETEPGPFGALHIRVGGHPIGREGEEVSLYPVLTTLEEALALSSNLEAGHQLVSSTEFFDGFDLYVGGHEDRVQLRQVGPDEAVVDASVSRDDMRQTLRDFRNALAALSPRIAPAKPDTSP